jgi:hypothetical protein
LNVRLTGPGREGRRPQEEGQHKAIKCFDSGHKPAKPTEMDFKVPAGFIYKPALAETVRALSFTNTKKHRPRGASRRAV